MPVFQSDTTYALLDVSENKKTQNEIELAGARCVLFPSPQIEAVEISEESRPLINNLADFNWVIFPDIFAVEFFLNALEKLDIDFFELDTLQVCAYGETVADFLRYSQLHADVIANSVLTENVWRDLNAYETSVADSSFLIPQCANLIVEIARKLNAARANVTELPVYQASIDDSKQIPKLVALLKGGAIDEFIFRSPAEIVKLSILFGDQENFSELFAETFVSAANPQTANALREYGITKIKFRQ